MDVRILKKHIRKCWPQDCLEITEKEKRTLVNSLFDAGSKELAEEIEAFIPGQLEDFIINRAGKKP